MPPGGRSRSLSLDHTTREQLDELDILMQRMLALPVNEPNDAGTPAPEEASAAELQTPAPSDVFQSATSSTVPSAQVHKQPEKAAFAGLEAQAPIQPNLVRSVKVMSKRATFPRVVWPLRPLWWVNGAFDWGTSWLGAPGRRLRGPAGRSLLGWTGLLLLAAAFVWFALEGMGWTW